MSQIVKLERFYPYPPQQVWQVLTDRQMLIAWLLDNNFEPRLGHKFQFQSHPLPGLEQTIYCKVIELDEPKRLVYTWREGSTHQPTIVIWMLTPVDGGTQLRLEHRAVEGQIVKLSQPKPCDGLRSFGLRQAPWPEASTMSSVERSRATSWRPSLAV